MGNGGPIYPTAKHNAEILELVATNLQCQKLHQLSSAPNTKISLFIAETKLCVSTMQCRLDVVKMMTEDERDRCQTFLTQGIY